MWNGYSGLFAIAVLTRLKNSAVRDVAGWRLRKWHGALKPLRQ
jgi:hypothetical protein